MNHGYIRYTLLFKILGSVRFVKNILGVAVVLACDSEDVVFS